MKPNKLQRPRIPWIDTWRGIAVLAMIFYHAVYDLNRFGVESILPHVYFEDWVWDWTSSFIGGSFFILAGISAGMIHDSRKLIAHGFKILSCGLLITVLTKFLTPGYVTYFGVLHCLGVSVLLSPFFKKPQTPTLFILAFISVLGGILMPELGIYDPGDTRGDFYPLLPWFGVFLCGLLWSRYVTTTTAHGPRARRFHVLSFLGQNSLLIYLIHQPLLLGMLYLLGWVRFESF